jgi:hypothetical protein
VLIGEFSPEKEMNEKKKGVELDAGLRQFLWCDGTIYAVIESLQIVQYCQYQYASSLGKDT